jgi:hypothetical protein
VKIPKFYEKVMVHYTQRRIPGKDKKKPPVPYPVTTVFNLQAKKSVQFSDVKLKNGLIAVCKKRLDVNNEN